MQWKREEEKKRQGDAESNFTSRGIRCVGDGAYIPPVRISQFHVDLFGACVGSVYKPGAFVVD